jgi:hypothetical protein
LAVAGVESINAVSFSSTHNEPHPVTAMRACNPDGSSLKIEGLKTQLQLLSMIAPRSLAVSARRLLWEKLSDHALLVFVLDAREQLCSQLSDCFWFIERQLLIHLAALKVTGLAAGLEYRPDVRSESWPFCHCLDRGEGRQENERTHEKKTRNKTMPKHQLNNAPISKTRNAVSLTAVATTALVRRLSGCRANPNRNGGSSKASPINFFTSQSDET